MRYLGDYDKNGTVTFLFGTTSKSGSSIDPSTVGTIRVYKDDNAVERSDGIIYTIGHDSLPGVHLCQIDLSHSFYEAQSDYSVVLTGAVVDGENVNVPLATFSIRNRVPEIVRQILCNKAVQNKNTGAVEYYDDEGESVVLTHTPTDGESTLTRTPS